MKNQYVLLFLFLSITSFCFTQNKNNDDKSDYVIAFGSCNKQNEPQPLWNEVLKNTPNLFIWGGDNIYGDSDDMQKIANDYKLQNNNPEYQKLKKTVPVLATWDDHDYGKNDAGVEWEKKKESQQLFLDFLDVPKGDLRRSQEGIYLSKVFELEKATIKVIILDTRYFRSALQRKDSNEKKRYEPWDNGEGTILGDTQWKWLEEELASSYADFNIIVSSIQFLSAEHGFETWGNFPHEVERLKRLLIDKKVKNIILLSGDRHISELSMTKVSGLNYPLVDFTSSGLTHAYTAYKGESNKYRLGNVVSVPSFGLLKFNFDANEVVMEMRGENNMLLQKFKQKYPR
ncbi:alkaline phosphatase D family protein [Aquimarina sp. MMG016]|uniref:alkaline phosphatase D family protein n=1 Tax=Aquimarina sp. MMG016 TaxID=2822690 RepID=UPI001B3A1563|nr:alkaline phosphatase D family protein [Aquimarina sp. MMG016]MBQ4822675.1 alkaline phosphatase family protein [Aquimarina sp. MMG016]